jgi:CelD/BcsL family acetyltransferase involved in cellulose biosynthesis
VSVEVVPDEPCPRLSLPDHSKRLEEAIPAKFLKKLRYARRRAAREGEVRVETATADTVDHGLDALLQLHRARWRNRGEDGVLHPRAERFHRDVATAFASRGALRLHMLHMNEQLAAVFYGFHAHRRTSYYLGGFDPDLKILSPGNLVLFHAVETAVRDGAAEFDFLRGREAYKYDWGAVDRPHFRVEWRREYR